MTSPREKFIDLDGHAIRIWSKGDSPRKIGVFAGWGGLPRWTQFLDELSRDRTVIAPALPGFPGGGRAHADLDSHLDWIVAARKIFIAAGLDGADLVGESVGGALAAEIAALWPHAVRRLALISPLGFYEAADPPADLFARRADEYPAFLCARPGAFSQLVAAPDGANSVEWEIEQARAAEACARLLWPLGDTGLGRRAGMIASPTLLLRGAEDRVLSQGAMQRIGDRIGGGTRLHAIAGAGHLASLDNPLEVASAIREFTR